ncbi:MAG: hypothetical protein PVF74_10650 [Anaerolineales bacterium]
MVVDRVVEPSRAFHIFVARCERRGVGEANVYNQRWEGAGTGVVTIVKRHVISVPIREFTLATVSKNSFFISDDIAGVVGNDVEVHLDTQGMSGFNEGRHLGVTAEVGVDLAIVNLPIAVIAS